MIGYIINRLILAVPLLIAVLLVSFLMLWALPGDPTHALLGRHWTPEAAEAMRVREGLDKPLPEQFANYLGDVTSGDLGASNSTNVPVVEELKRRIPATIELSLAAMLIATIVGVSLGILSALKPRSWLDMLGLTGALVGVSVPIFWLGIMAQRTVQSGGWLSSLIPGFHLPTSGRHADTLQLAESVANTPSATGFYLYDTLFVFRDMQAFLDVFAHLALPAIVLASIPTAMITRITRSAIGEALQQDYIRTARAKGLGTRSIVTRHALRNAAIPIVTTAGTQLGYLLGGAVLTETIFSWPGLGRYVIEAIDTQDIKPLQGSILFIAVVFIVVNLLVDLSYAVLDPRVRKAGGSK